MATVQADSRNLSWFDASMIMVNTIVGTGIFTLPAYVFKNVGTVGWYLLLWPVGGLYALCGYLCWLELGLGIPRSGGEKNYLERVYKHPRGLMSIIFMVLTTVLYNSSPNAVAFGRYLLFVAGDSNDSWPARGIAVGVITIVCLIHSFTPSLGRSLMKWLGVAKIVMLFAMIIMGFLSLIRVLKPVGEPLSNFKNAFSPPKGACPAREILPLTNPPCTHIPKPDAHSVSWALMSIIFSFSGWNSINFVLGEVKDPNRSMRLAGFTSIALVTTIYMLANIAIFAVIPARDIGSSDLLISGDMFERATKSKGAAKAAGIFVALSNLGNVFSFSFGLARIVHEYARSGMFPFSGFFAKTTSKGSPAAGFLAHWFWSVILIIGPPPGSAYNFLVNLPTYAIVLIMLVVANGLLYLRMRPQITGWTSPFSCPIPVIVLFISYCLFLTVAPWIPSMKNTDDNAMAEEMKEEGGFAWYLTPVCGFAVLFAGTVYWFLWLHVIPAVCGRKLVEEEVMTDDGQSYTRYISIQGRRRYFEKGEKEAVESTPTSTSQGNA